MNPLLQTVASNAVAALLLALLVAVATRFIRRPQVVYWLWMLVLIKLVTPPMISVPLPLDLDVGSKKGSVRNSIAGRRLPEAVRDSGNSREGLPSSDATPASMDEPPSRVSKSSMSFQRRLMDRSTRKPGLALPWQQVLLGIGVMGSLFWYVLVGLRTVRFDRLLKESRPAPPSLRAETHELAIRMGLRHPPGLALVGGRLPPLLWRLRSRPVIVLPANLLERLEPGERRTLIAHELAHFRRRDHWIRWLEVAILGLYWWHPVAWWVRRRVHEAEEACCDCWVLWALPDNKKCYARTLLAAVEFMIPTRPKALPLASGFGRFLILKRRMEMILGQQFSHRMPLTGFIALVLLSLAVLPWSSVSLEAQSVSSENTKGTQAIVGEDAQTDVSGADWYKVRVGDTLHIIAKRCYGTEKAWKQILAANPDLDPMRLAVGQVIRIRPPPPSPSRRIVPHADFASQVTSIARKGCVYTVDARDRTVTSFNAKTGKVIWRIHSDRVLPRHSIKVQGGKLRLFDEAKQLLLELELRTGQVPKQADKVR